MSKSHRKLPEGLRKRGNIYYAWFQSGNVRVRKRLSHNLQVAKVLLNDMRAKLDRGDLGVVDNRYPWQLALDEYLRWANQTKRCAGEYEAILNRYRDYRPIKLLSQVTVDYMVGYRDWRLSHGVAPSTINKEVKRLKGMLNKLVTWRRIKSNPIRDLDRRPEDVPVKNRRAVTLDEVNRLLEVSGPRRLMWLFFLSTGVRSGELCSARFDWVDWDRRTITVPKISKTHCEREIPLSDELHDGLRAVHQSNPEQVWLFPGRRHDGSRGRDGILDALYRDCHRAGIEGAHQGGTVDVHALRVSFTTLSIDGGAKPGAVQQILGHKTLAMTMNVYNRVSDGSKRDAVSALPFAKASTPDHILTIQSGTDMAQASGKAANTQGKVG